MEGNLATVFGGAIFNERSDTVIFKASTLKGNVADVSGGAIYSEAQTSVIINDATDSSRFVNNSANSGGAVSVQAGVNLELRALSFDLNKAVRGGAVYCRQGAKLILRNMLFSFNGATGEGGAVYLDSGVMASILDSTFFANSATKGGFAYIGHGGSLMSFGSTLTYNRAQCGGAIAASRATITAENTKCLSNVGDHGGAFYLDESQFASAGGCIYEQNRALYGGIASLEAGSELFLKETDSGGGNNATYGGGEFAHPWLCRLSSPCLTGVAFYDHRTTAQPLNPPSNVTATAVFGPTFATGLASLRATHHGQEVNRREFVNPIRFKAYDDLGQEYLARDIETIELELEPPEGSLIGTTLLHLRKGQAETSGILVSYKPDANVTIVARIAHSKVVTRLNVTLRGCFLGEIGHDCRACTDIAKYSLDPRDEACLDCPKHASCDSEKATDPDSKGALIILKAGYWRSGPFSTNIRKCPYAEACKGGVDLLTTEDSCRNNHRGPMCTLCKKEEDGDERYLLNRSSGKCHKCSSKILDVLTISLILAIAFMVVVAIAVLMILSHEHNLFTSAFLRQSSKSLEGSQLIRTIDALVPMIKIVFVFIQVVSSEYSTFLFVDYPTMLDKVIVFLSFSRNFAVHAILATLCIRINHYSELLSATLVPIVIFASSELIYFVASCRTTTDHLRKKIRDYTTFVRLITLFVVYSTTSVVICATFRCDDGFGRENEGSRYSNRSYLAVDYSISCKKRIHKRFLIYSAVMVFIYPVGVPLYFFCLLWLKRSIINPNANELAQEILNRKHERTVTTNTGGDKNNEDAWAGACNDVIAEGDLRLHALRYTTAVSLCEAHENLRPLTPGLRTLRRNLVASQARLDGKVSHLGFLFFEYSPDCWWFESVECIRRLFLTAVFPAVYSVDNDAGLLYSTFLLSVLFLGIYVVMQPVVDERVNQFAVRMQAAVSLILFLTIILYSEERLENADSARWDRPAIGVVLTFLSTCLGPIMVVYHAQLRGLQLSCTCCNRCRHPRKLGDSDQRIAVHLDDEEEKESGEHSDLKNDFDAVQEFGEVTSISTLSRDEGDVAHKIADPDGNAQKIPDPDSDDAHKIPDLDGDDTHNIPDPEGDNNGNEDREAQRGDDSSNDRYPPKYADFPVSYFPEVERHICSRASCL